MGRREGRRRFIKECGLPLRYHTCKLELLPRSYANNGARDDDAEPWSSLGWDSEDHLLQYWRQGCRRKCTHCDRDTGESLQYWKEQPIHWCEKRRENHDWHSVHFLYNEYTGKNSDRVICHGCSPELTPLKCWSCDKEKMMLELPVSERGNLKII